MSDMNLDAEINKLSYEMFCDIKKKDKKEGNKKMQNLCEKALWVLSQDWPYAYSVFIESEDAEGIYLETIFSGDYWIIDIFDNLNWKNYKREIEKLSENLNQYLYFKEILEKILTYLRYHLKTLDNNQDDDE